jgi:hypothetical protein
MQYLLPGVEKWFFVFSDGPPSMFTDENVTLLFQKNLGWPGNTLKRFHMFLRIEEMLRSFDYIFFFNANCVFKKNIGLEMLPSVEEKLVVVQHPGYFETKSANKFPYDRNPSSLAYIPMDRGEYYFAGGINGGTSEAYLGLIRDLARAVDGDEANEVLAVWHDESHLNKYLLGRKYKMLPPSYCYPENWKLPFEEIICVRDKSLAGGHAYLRGERVRPRWKVATFLHRLKRRLKP